MSGISDTARVSITVADFANTDASNKLNIVGGGVAITALEPRTGQSAALTVVLSVAVEPSHIGQQYALELALYGDDGQLVTPPAPYDTQPIRIARPVTVEAPTAPQGAYLPPGAVWPAAQVIMNFVGGLPLAAGQTYIWRASIDGNVVCEAGLHVAAPPPVVFG